MKKVTAAYLAEELSFTCDAVGRKKDGTFIARLGYFYTQGKTAEMFRNRIATALKVMALDFTIIDVGNHWAAFSGSAPLARQSHWWVNFKINEPSTKEETKS